MKKIILLVLFSLSIAPQLRSQDNIIINVLDKTAGKTKLSFYESPTIRYGDFLAVNKEKTYGEKQVTSDSTYTITIEGFNKPDIVFAKLFMSRNSKLALITPGDTLLAVIDFKDDKNDFEVVFYGDNEANYNTYYDLNKKIDRNELLKTVRSGMPFQEYMPLLDSAYISNTQMLNELEPSLIKNLLLEDEKAQIFYYLSYAKEKPSQLEAREVKNKYFSSEPICADPLFLKSLTYDVGVSYLGSLMSKSIEAENQLEAELDSIEKYFCGELKEFLFINKFTSAVSRSKKNSNITESDVENWYRQYAGSMQNNIFNEYIEYRYRMFRMLNRPFPEIVLSEKITRLSDGSVSTIRELLEKHKGTQIVVDNWATWCGPCLREIRVGKKNVQKLIEQGNLFLYFSLDEPRNAQKAKEKAEELDIIEHAYLVHGALKSEYAEYLEISDIPRFIMIDKEGKVKNLRMRFPSHVYDFSNYGR